MHSLSPTAKSMPGWNIGTGNLAAIAPCLVTMMLIIVVLTAIVAAGLIAGGTSSLVEFVTTHFS